MFRKVRRRILPLLAVCHFILAPRLLDLLRDGPGNFQNGLGVLAILPLAAMLLLIPLRRLRVTA